MELSGIQSFLEEYRKRLFRADDHRRQILRIINETAGVSLGEKDIELKKQEILLHVDSVLRNEIFLFREKILGRLKEEGVIGVYDIH